MREIQLRAWGNNEMYYFDDADRGQWTCSIDNGKIKLIVNEYLNNSEQPTHSKADEMGF